MADEEQHHRLDPRLDPRDEIAEASGSLLSTRTLVVALVAGIAAAVAGGVAWGYVVKAFDYELGIAAWGIGVVAGLAVNAVSGPRRAAPLQVVAVAAALVGIAAGKYLGFALVVGEGADVGVLSSAMREAFFDNLSIVFGWFDLLWVGFAVYAAWRLTRPAAHAPVPTD